jgi:hypothetical protein
LALTQNEPRRLSQTGRLAKVQSESRASLESFDFSVAWLFRRGHARGQKALVDHVCPATFSQWRPDRKIPLTIVT